MATVLDSSILAPLFSDDEIAALLRDDAFVRKLVDVEIAVARAEARVGVIPASAAEKIASAHAEKIDISALTAGTLRSGFPIIALVQELRKQVSADAAPYVHWGATTQDIILLAQTEVGEVGESGEAGRGGSSTMPQKRNPISSELIVACAKLVRQHAALMLDAMVQDFERATGPWHAEWIALPEAFILAGGALNQAKFMLDGLDRKSVV